MPLIERADSLLIVVDAQPGFSGFSDDDKAAAAQARQIAAWLVRVAAALDLPVIVTEEEPARNGPTHPVIADALPPSSRVFVKPVFGLADVPEILAAVERTGRRTAVLVGAETDVCVAHSAVGLLDRGFRVVVVADATFSPGPMHERGLAHARDAGAEVRHAKGVYYDWMRSVGAARAFVTEHPALASPPGFAL